LVYIGQGRELLDADGKPIEKLGVPFQLESIEEPGPRSHGVGDRSFAEELEFQVFAYRHPASHSPEKVRLSSG